MIESRQGSQANPGGKDLPPSSAGWESRSSEKRERRSSRIEPLRYLAPGEEGDVIPQEFSESGQDADAESEQDRASLAAREAEWQRQAEAIRQEAYAAGRAAADGERTAQLRAMAGQWETAIEGFYRDRDQYFARVEREVVELALTIAARILQREAQLDPLLLSGAVRVALGQLGETTAVQLRVPASAHALWAETLRLMPNLPVYPELIADSEMREGEAILETRMGRVDLGMRAQLKEIERGFFDLLSHREPASAGRGQTHAGQS